jgi:hypothetical protein
MTARTALHCSTALYCSYINMMLLCSGGCLQVAKIANKGDAWKYSSKLWTTTNVLNQNDLTLNNADAK